MFLDQLVNALHHRLESTPEIGATALLHGHDLLLQGFTVSQVVRAYGDVCQSITELALETNTPIGTNDFRTLNRCLDDAVAGAVTQYGRERNQSSIHAEAAHGSERLGFLAHELRTLSNTATLAFEVLKTGNMGTAGTTGAVLDRSLTGIGALISRSLAEVRLTHPVQNRERFRVAQLIQDLTPSAQMEASAKGITFTMTPVAYGVAIEADRQVLASAVGNLLHNAFKFTRPCTTVTLRVGANTDRVLIEVQDQCGGLPGRKVNDLSRPFEQRSVDRIGVALGLAFSRSAVEANHGRIYARSLPESGCVFTIDLPRVESSGLREDALRP
jgi:signal transduction histidine kinase